MLLVLRATGALIHPWWFGESVCVGVKKISLLNLTKTPSPANPALSNYASLKWTNWKKPQTSCPYSVLKLKALVSFRKSKTFMRLMLNHHISLLYWSIDCKLQKVSHFLPAHWEQRIGRGEVMFMSKCNIWVSVSNMSPLICIILFLPLAEGVFTMLSILYYQFLDTSEHCFWHNFIKVQSLTKFPQMENFLLWMPCHLNPAGVYFLIIACQKI